ncbi:hypothetical protein [Anaerosolibacter sp.]|uniref:hypothetical protein n=1 Tax=Anaerosolibacter sp. TaxID=1872527 RepID=UPI0039EEBDBA
MVSKEEIQYLTQFCITRPLNGLNGMQYQKVLNILEKLAKAGEEHGAECRD